MSSVLIFTSTTTAHKRDLLGKMISQERSTLISGVSPDCGKYENYNNHGTFGRWMNLKGIDRIQQKIFIRSSHRSSVHHVFPPCPHKKIWFQIALFLANNRTGKKSREQTR